MKIIHQGKLYINIKIFVVIETGSNKRLGCPSWILCYEVFRLRDVIQTPEPDLLLNK